MKQATKSTPEQRRLKALQRFALATTILNIVGQLKLGFEMPWAQYAVALGVCYGVDLILETLRARELGVRPRYHGGWRPFIDFLLPAHITGMTTAMFLYAGDKLWSIAFAACLAIASKYLLTVNMNGRQHHFLNPSNTGIIFSTVLFSQVTVSAPWQFLSHTSGGSDLILPIVIVATGTALNFFLTRRIPLIVAWLVAFVLQAVVRWIAFDQNFYAILFAATGPVAVLFTFYMVSDPGSTPSSFRGQTIFGAAVGFAYGLLTMLHVTYGLFWGLLLVCGVRGAILWYDGHKHQLMSASAPSQAALPKSA